MSEEYKPGMTELRLNAKSNLTNLSQVFKRLEEQAVELQEMRDQLTYVQQSNADLQAGMSSLKAKLYENGIR